MQQAPITEKTLRNKLAAALEKSPSAYLEGRIASFFDFLYRAEPLGDAAEFNGFCELAQFISKAESYQESQKLILEKLCMTYGPATAGDKKRIEYIAISLLGNVIQTETVRNKNQLAGKLISSVSVDSDTANAAEQGIRTAIKYASTRPVTSFISFFRSAVHNAILSEQRKFTPSRVDAVAGGERAARLAEASAHSLTAPLGEGSGLTIESQLSSISLSPERAVSQHAQEQRLRSALSLLYGGATPGEQKLLLAAISPFFAYETAIDPKAEERGYRNSPEIAAELGIHKGTVVRQRRTGTISSPGMQARLTAILASTLDVSQPIHPEIAQATAAMDRSIPSQEDHEDHVQRLLKEQMRSQVNPDLQR